MSFTIASIPMRTMSPARQVRHALGRPAHDQRRRQRLTANHSQPDLRRGIHNQFTGLFQGAGVSLASGHQYGGLAMRDQTINAKKPMWRRISFTVILACGLALAVSSTGVAETVTRQVTTTTLTQPPQAAVAQPSVNDPQFWLGRNIGTAVHTFGQPSYWNASHDGGGGGGRYIFNKPGQPHFVFETQPGGQIVHAARLSN
jgi:hypothetical protein